MFTLSLRDATASEETTSVHDLFSSIVRSQNTTVSHWSVEDQNHFIKERWSGFTWMRIKD